MAISLRHFTIITIFLLLLVPFLSATPYDRLPKDQLLGQELPPGIRAVFGNERAVIHVQGEQEYLISVVTKANSIVGISEGAVQDPTVNLFLSEAAFDDILDSSNPAKAFLQAKKDGKVRLKAVGIGNKIKYSAASLVTVFMPGSAEAKEEKEKNERATKIKEELKKQKRPSPQQPKKKIRRAIPGQVEQPLTPTSHPTMIHTEESSCVADAFTCIGQYIEQVENASAEARANATEENTTERRWIDFIERLHEQEGGQEDAQGGQELSDEEREALEEYVIRTPEEAAAAEAAQQEEEDPGELEEESESLLDLIKRVLGMSGEEESMEETEGGEAAEDTVPDEASEPEEQEPEAPEDRESESASESDVDPLHDPVVFFPTSGRKLLLINDLNPHTPLNWDNWVVSVQIADNVDSLFSLSSEVLESRTDPGSGLSWLCDPSQPGDPSYPGPTGALIAEMIETDSSRRNVDPATLIDPGLYFGSWPYPGYQYFEIPDDTVPTESISYYLRVRFGTWNPSSDYTCWQKDYHEGTFCDGSWQDKGFILPINDHPPGTTLAIKMSGFAPDAGYYGSTICGMYG